MLCSLLRKLNCRCCPEAVALLAGRENPHGSGRATGKKAPGILDATQKGYTKFLAFIGSPNTSSCLLSSALHSSPEKSPRDGKYKSVHKFRSMFKYHWCLKGPSQNSLPLISKIKFGPFNSMYLIRKDH